MTPRRRSPAPLLPVTAANPPPSRGQTRLRALVTNDDGVDAAGIRWLAHAAVSAGLDVVVAAPKRESSGMSASLSAVYKKRRIAYTPYSIADVSVPTYGVAASPGYIAVLASLGTFGPPPELVLSGINRGANAGYAIIHSGTVGAALTGASHGARAIAVSLDILTALDAAQVGGADPATGGASLADAIEILDEQTLNWATAAHITAGLIPQLAQLPERSVINLNVPNRPLPELAGVRQATLAPFGQVQMVVAESGEGYVRTVIEPRDEDWAEETDLALLSQGYATVTVVRAVAPQTDISLELNFAGPSPI